MSSVLPFDAKAIPRLEFLTPGLVGDELGIGVEEGEREADVDDGEGEDESDFNDEEGEGVEDTAFVSAKICVGDEDDDVWVIDVDVRLKVCAQAEAKRQEKGTQEAALSIIVQTFTKGKERETGRMSWGSKREF